MQQRSAVVECSHLDLGAEGVPVVDQAAQDVLPQVGLQLLQHPLNAAPHCHTGRMVLHVIETALGDARCRPCSYPSACLGTACSRLACNTMGFDARVTGTLPRDISLLIYVSKFCEGFANEFFGHTGCKYGTELCA